MMKKLLLGIAAIALLASSGGLWWVYHSLDAQIASAIRRYGSEMTGVPVGLSSAHVAIADGRGTLRGLIVGNPDGFKTKYALSLGEISMTLDIGSLTTDVIRIKELTLIKPEVTYEYASSGSNLEVLQRNIERSIAQQRSDAKNTQSDKKLVIEHLYIKSGTASVSAEMLNGDVLSVPIADLHLQNIGKKSDGTTAGEAMRQIFGPLVQQVGTAVASLGVKAAGKTIQKGVEAATQTIKGLFK
jgi:uncharacterized protein involved in outer membrane biogenesis